MRAGLNAVNIYGGTAGAALPYVPDVKVIGGSIGFLGVAGVGFLCGQLVSTVPSRCVSGFGESYVGKNLGRRAVHCRHLHDAALARRRN